MAKRTAADTVVIKYEHHADTSDQGIGKFQDVAEAREYLVFSFMPDILDAMDERAGHIVDDKMEDSTEAYEHMKEFGDLGRALLKIRNMAELETWIEDWNRFAEDNYFDHKLELG